ncbi:aldehyde dehydrogenase family protein [Streptomyces roseus]|uniref:aldehyde dehydrogenase family protein n=1 Tax=Streptomyces roseus TaxID=66430 RepID=UPI0033C27111
MIPLWQAAPALACGSAFILKPFERDRSVPLRLEELFLEAGLPPGVLNVVNGGEEAVDTLLEERRRSTGRACRGRPRWRRCARRSGCQEPHDRDARRRPRPGRVDALIGAGYGSVGERCMAISVAVPAGEDTADRLVTALKDRIATPRIGRSAHPDADFGPLVGRDALDRVRRYVDIGANQGAEGGTGGPARRLNGPGRTSGASGGCD